jgi:hypothetical protein
MFTLLVKMFRTEKHRPYLNKKGKGFHYFEGTLHMWGRVVPIGEFGLISTLQFGVYKCFTG